MLLCLLAAGQLFAQEQQYFVYIQNEKPQPFYVKYNGKVLSSSDRGYIIIAELPAGTTPLTVGFPKNEAPEQQFQVKLGKNDQGYLLKQTDEKNFALYNLQTFSVTKANTADKAPEQPVAAAGGEMAAALTDTNTTPAAPVATETPAATGDTTGQAMMAALRKDLDTALGGKAEITTTGKAAPPKKANNKFAETLDKVVHDDRPEEIAVEAPPAAAPAAVAATGAVVDASGVVLTPEPKKNRRKRKQERAALTDEEQALLKQVMDDEHKAAQADSAATVDAPAAAPAEIPAAPANTEAATQPVAAAETPVTDTAAVVKDEAPKKARKGKKKKSSDPEFIEFMDDSTGQRSSVPATEAAAAPAAKETVADVAAPAANAAAPAVTDASAVTLETPKVSKKKKRKLAELADAEERPNNIVTDSVDYAAPVRKEKAAKEEGVKMINSDCANTMDETAFRKLLRKFVSAKDDDGMITTFQRNTRGYCLETAQVKRLAQLVGTDEYRYRLLDMAYPKVYDSEKFADLSSLLIDNYYQSRFKAMLRK